MVLLQDFALASARLACARAPQSRIQTVMVHVEYATGYSDRLLRVLLQPRERLLASLVVAEGGVKASRVHSSSCFLKRRSSEVNTVYEEEHRRV